MNFTVSWGPASIVDLILKWITIFAVAGGAISAAIAVRSYRHNVGLKRAEWLQKLFQQFYEQDRYRDVRNLLDYRPERELAPLLEHVVADTRDARVDQLWDYLNFFEFVKVWSS